MLRRRGFTVVEFIVASVLTLSLVTTVSLASSSLQRSLNDNRIKTQVALYAANVLEKARALNCGTAVQPDVAAGEPTTTITTGCNELIYGQASGSEPKGDFTWTHDVRPGTAGSAPTTLTVTMVTSWRPAITADTRDTATVTDSVDDQLDCTAITSQTSAVQPPAVLRTLRVSWTDPRTGTIKQQVYTDVQAYPGNPDLYLENLGTVAVTLNQKAGVEVTLVDPNKTGSGVLRRSVSCGTGSSLAWFPYLPAGNYQVVVGTTPARSVTVIAGQTKVEPA